MRMDWPAEDLMIIRNAIANKVRPCDIAKIFPLRNIRAVYAKIFYERHYAFSRNVAIIAEAVDGAVDEATPEGASIALSNQMQDIRFQTALRTAIEAGLENHPAKNAPHTEFRPAHFVPEPCAVPFGPSPALLCAELGAAR